MWVRLSSRMVLLLIMIMIMIMILLKRTLVMLRIMVENATDDNEEETDYDDYDDYDYNGGYADYDEDPEVG